MTDLTLREQFFNAVVNEEGAALSVAEDVPAGMIGHLFGSLDMEVYKALVEYARRTRVQTISPAAFLVFINQENSGLSQLTDTGVQKMFSDWSAAKPITLEEASGLIRNAIANDRMMRAVQEMQGILQSEEVKTLDSQNKLRDLAGEVDRLTGEVGYDPLEEVDSIAELLDITESFSERLPFISTPFPTLNRVLGYEEDGGLFRGAINCIAGASGSGKSIFCMSLMRSFIDQGFRCAYVNYEVEKKIWLANLFAQVTGRNPIKYVGGPGYDKANKKWEETIKRWGDSFVPHLNPSSIAYEDVERFARELNHRKKLDVIFIDTINSIAPRMSYSMKRHEQYEYMMVRLERLALSLGVCIVITAQENRDKMKERRPVSMMSDIGGSLDINRKSAVVLHLNRPQMPGDEYGKSPFTELHVTKNRITGKTATNMGGEDIPRVAYDDDRKSYLPFEGTPANDEFGEIDLDGATW